MLNPHIRSLLLAGIAITTATAAYTAATDADNHAAAPQWFKGNTHTHTYWSDGNAAPEHVIDWYVENDYDFLVLSDHNILSQGEKWFPISEEGGRPLRSEDVADLERRFGPDWVVERVKDDQRQMRLKTLPELRERFEKPREFILIQGEEITDQYRRLQVHINGLNLEEVIPPQHGESARDTINRNMDAIYEQGKRLGRPVLGHLNHPNFQHSLSPEDVASIENEAYFEVYNGHRGVVNHGDELTPSTESIWDVAMTLRLTELDYGLLFGLATDDAHSHHGRGLTSVPGRGWVWVRAEELTPDAIVAALRSGSFYASNGVTLKDFGSTEDTLWLEIDPEPGVTYTTEFIGTRLGADGVVGEVGEILAQSGATHPSYHMTGDELYVRARVVSSRPHPNPFAAGDMETAWVQPARGPAAGE